MSLAQGRRPGTAAAMPQARLPLHMSTRRSSPCPAAVRRRHTALAPSNSVSARGTSARRGLELETHEARPADPVCLRPLVLWPFAHDILQPSANFFISSGPVLG